MIEILAFEHKLKLPFKQSDFVRQLLLVLLKIGNTTSMIKKECVRFLKYEEG